MTAFKSKRQKADLDSQAVQNFIDQGEDKHAAPTVKPKAKAPEQPAQPWESVDPAGQAAFSLRLPAALYEKLKYVVGELPKSQAGSNNAYIVKAIEASVDADLAALLGDWKTKP